ncbi:breast carcinoma-amplified sequence 4 isoform X1 [Cavia porcellus]|uniref:breast carcinoma-amplified sequence 4 isoform X1 n=1 Tax=Cavia porcellus TaxID=10141 RepID=UPI002FE103D6
MLLVEDDRPDPVLSGLHELALLLTPEPGAEAREVEAAIEGMLLLLEEFCSLMDTIRSDTSQILEENIPLLKARVTEMRGIYAKVDRLEAFVRMVGHHATFLEAHVRQAEHNCGAFPQTLRRWLGSVWPSSFRKKPSAAVPAAVELPTLFRMEDYFPADTPEVQRRGPDCLSPCELCHPAGMWD